MPRLRKEYGGRLLRKSQDFRQHAGRNLTSEVLRLPLRARFRFFGSGSNPALGGRVGIVMNTIRPKSWFLLMPPVVLALLLGGARAMPGFTPDSCAAGQSAVLPSAGGCGHCALKTQNSPATSSPVKTAKRSCCGGGSCCQQQVATNTACGPACHCKSRAPGSDRSPYALPRQSRTLVDLELARAAIVPQFVVPPQAPLAFLLESANSRGSPTLVAQHVRLQI